MCQEKPNAKRNKDSDELRARICTTKLPTNEKGLKERSSSMQWKAITNLMEGVSQVLAPSSNRIWQLWPRSSNFRDKDRKRVYEVLAKSRKALRPDEYQGCSCMEVQRGDCVKL